MSALSREMDVTDYEITHLTRGFSQVPEKALDNPLQPQMRNATIIDQTAQERWLLDNGLKVCRAHSCLVEPAIGDTVIVYEYRQSEILTGCVLAILERAQSLEQELPQQISQLSVPNNKALQINANELMLVGTHQLDLVSNGDASLQAPAGRIIVSAKHLLHSIQDTLVQVCRQMFGRNEQYHMNSEQLNKTHARHQLMTADKDIRVDAQRINMG